MSSGLKLLIGAAGIYGAYMNYGLYQEQVFHYKSASGAKFTQTWFLNAAEAFTSVLVALVGFALFKSNAPGALPQALIAVSGLSQVTAKASFSLGLVYKVSYAVATLAKSAKMAPVMVGNILRGVTYKFMQYLQVGAIIAGTIMVSWKPPPKDPCASLSGSALSKCVASKKVDESSMLGVAFVCVSLICDGITSNMQGQSKNKMKAAKLEEKPHESMFYTNLYMGIFALAAALYFGEVKTGLELCNANPELLEKIAKFCVCSAFGQIFIFFTITSFDSLTSTTITTTRKIFTVLLSIYNNYKETPLSPLGWTGLAVATVGILFEIAEKAGGHGHAAKDKKA